MVGIHVSRQFTDTAILTLARARLVFADLKAIQSLDALAASDLLRSIFAKVLQYNRTRVVSCCVAAQRRCYVRDSSEVFALRSSLVEACGTRASFVGGQLRG